MMREADGCHSPLQERRLLTLRVLTDALLQRGHYAAGLARNSRSLSAKVLHHSPDAKDDGGEQHGDDNRRPISSLCAHETGGDNKKSSNEARHRYPSLP